MLPRVILLSLALMPLSLTLAQSVPGYQVQTYALVTDPQRFCFAPDGSIYCGRDASGSGGTNSQAVKIHRVFPCGAKTVEFGNATIQDPDAVAFDATGSFSGVTGAVIVGSNVATNSGKISIIRPDETISTVVGPSNVIINAADMAFDSSSRLLVADASVKVARFTGLTPATVFTSSAAVFLAIAPNQDIYSSGTDGIIRINSQSGAAVNGSFQAFGSSPNGVAIAIGPGSLTFPGAVYAQRTTGLYSIAANGTRTTIGSGFTNSNYDLEFGPDGCLYMSDFGNDRILRIAPPATTTITGKVNFNDFDYGTPPTQLDIMVRNPATGTVLSITPVTLGANGEFTVTTTATGCYSVSTKARAWLRRSAIVDARLGNVAGVEINLVNGDIDEDDVIGVFDYILLSGAFDAGPGDAAWVPNADLDGDDVVSVFDYLILSKNFDEEAT